MARCFQEYFSKVVTTEFHFTTKGCLQCPFRDFGSVSKCSHSHRRAVPARQPVISTSGFFTCALRAANRTAGAIVDLHSQRIICSGRRRKAPLRPGSRTERRLLSLPARVGKCSATTASFRGKNAGPMADGVYSIASLAVVMSGSRLSDFLRHLFCDVTYRICQVEQEVKEKEK